MRSYLTRLMPAASPNSSSEVDTNRMPSFSSSEHAVIAPFPKLVH